MNPLKDQKGARERYHNRKFWKWFVLAFIYSIVALFISAFTENKGWADLTWFWMAVAGGSVLLAAVHNNLEKTCTTTEDCGADHTE